MTDSVDIRATSAVRKQELGLVDEREFNRTTGNGRSLAKTDYKRLKNALTIPRLYVDS
jgi:hypothetical protein